MWRQIQWRIVAKAAAIVVGAILTVLVGAGLISPEVADALRAAVEQLVLLLRPSG